MGGTWKALFVRHAFRADSDLVTPAGGTRLAKGRRMSLPLLWLGAGAPVRQFEIGVPAQLKRSFSVP
jgi:hypothetical protein